MEKSIKIRRKFEIIKMLYPEVYIQPSLFSHTQDLVPRFRPQDVIGVKIIEILTQTYTNVAQRRVVIIEIVGTYLTHKNIPHVFL